MALRPLGGPAQVSSTIKMANIESELKFLSQTLERLRGPGHYNIQAGSICSRINNNSKNIKKQRPTTQIHDQTSPRATYIGEKTAAASAMPGPTDYEQGHSSMKMLVRQGPKWSIPESRRGLSLSMRQNFEMAEKLNAHRTSPPKDMIGWNRKAQGESKETKQRHKEQQRQLREWRKRFADLKRKKLEEKRLKKLQEKLYRVSDEHQLEIEEKRRQELAVRARQQSWMTIVSVISAALQAKHMIDKSRSRRRWNKLVQCMFFGPWKNIVKQMGGESNFLRVMNKFMFRRNLRLWISNQLKTKRRMVPVVISALQTARQNTLKTRFYNRMKSFSTLIAKLQRSYRMRRKVNRWRKLAIALALCKAKLSQQLAVMPRKHAKILELMYNRLIPKIDKCSLDRATKQVFEARRRDYNLALINHLDYYKKKLETLLLKFFGITEAREGMQWSLVDFQMMCEIMSKDFPDKKAEKTFNRMDADKNGMVSFDEFLNFYFGRFKLHMNSTSAAGHARHAENTDTCHHDDECNECECQVLDPIDGKVRELCLQNNDEVPMFRLSFTQEEARSLCKLVVVV